MIATTPMLRAANRTAWFPNKPRSRPCCAPARSDVVTDDGPQRPEGDAAATQAFVSWSATTMDAAGHERIQWCETRRGARPDRARHPPVVPSGIRRLRRAARNARRSATPTSPSRSSRWPAASRPQRSDRRAVRERLGRHGVRYGPIAVACGPSSTQTVDPVGEIQPGLPAQVLDGPLDLPRSPSARRASVSSVSNHHDEPQHGRPRCPGARRDEHLDLVGRKHPPASDTLPSARSRRRPPAPPPSPPGSPRRACGRSSEERLDPPFHELRLVIDPDHVLDVDLVRDHLEKGVQVGWAAPEARSTGGRAAGGPESSLGAERADQVTAPGHGWSHPPAPGRGAPPARPPASGSGDAVGAGSPTATTSSGASPPSGTEQRRQHPRQPVRASGAWRTPRRVGRSSGREKRFRSAAGTTWRARR